MNNCRHDIPKHQCTECTPTITSVTSAEVDDLRMQLARMLSALEEIKQTAEDMLDPERRRGPSG